MPGRVKSGAGGGGGGGFTSPLTTKGDIHVYSTLDTRLAVGTDGYQLQADSSAATGLAWKPKDIGCIAVSTATLGINSASETAVAFADADLYDTDTMHDTSTNNNRITFNTAGKYLIWAKVYWAASATGIRAIWFKLNNTTYTGEFALGQSYTSGWTQQAAALWVVAASDYMECKVYQDRGSSLNVLGAYFGAQLLSV